MNRARIVIKRPLIHYLISLGYILAPIINILLLILIARIRLSDILQRMFQGYGYLAGIWLLTAPIVGIGLYFVHKASWYVFLAHSALILVDYVIKWSTIPTYYWMSVRGLHQILLFTGNLALVVVIGYILQRDFRSPYFQVLPRGWRTSRRVQIRYHIELNHRRCNINDLSDSGCFVAEPGLQVQVGEKVDISFQADTVPVACQGQIMRRTPDGYGVRFIGVKRKTKRDIRQLIRKRFPFRFPVKVQAKWLTDSRALDGTVRDISNRGCYIETAVADLREGEQGSLQLLVFHRQVGLPGVIAWINPVELLGKPAGFGMRFNKNQKSICHRIVRHQKKQSKA